MASFVFTSTLPLGTNLVSHKRLWHVNRKDAVCSLPEKRLFVVVFWPSMAKGKKGSSTLTKKVVSEVMRSMGRKGGKAKVPKGVATLGPAERLRRAKEAAAARWSQKNERPNKGND